MKKTEIVIIIENREIRKQIFNYGVFGLILAIGFAITLIYDIYNLRNTHK